MSFINLSKVRHRYKPSSSITGGWPFCTRLLTSGCGAFRSDLVISCTTPSCRKLNERLLITRYMIALWWYMIAKSCVLLPSLLDRSARIMHLGLSVCHHLRFKFGLNNLLKDSSPLRDRTKYDINAHHDVKLAIQWKNALWHSKVPHSDKVSLNISNEEPCKISHQWQHLTHQVLTTCIVTHILWNKFVNKATGACKS